MNIQSINNPNNKIYFACILANILLLPSKFIINKPIKTILLILIESIIVKKIFYKKKIVITNIISLIISINVIYNYFKKNYKIN